jgi:hypothetical protein
LLGGKENCWKNLLLLLMKGGNALALGSIDGVSHWKTLMHDMPSMRSHTLHNVDDVWGYAALRKDNWKLVKGFFPPFFASSVCYCHFFLDDSWLS